MHRSRLLLLSAVALLCASCSGAMDDAAKRPAGADATAAAAAHGSAVREAVTATGATTARIDQKIELGDSTRTHTMTVTGDFDMGGDKGTLVVTLPGGAVSRMDEVFLDDTVYLRGINGVETEWGSLARDKAEVHYLLRAPVNDPEHVLKQVAAMGQVSDEGQEKVNGAAATHYRGTLGRATVELRMARETRAQSAKIRELLEDDIPVYADAWVDARGRLVRTRLSYYGGGQGGVTTTMTLSDFGKPVKATAPPSGEVTPVTGSTGILPG